MNSDTLGKRKGEYKSEGINKFDHLDFRIEDEASTGGSGNTSMWNEDGLFE